uniref:Uncharacterized protein n=1 Tax=Ditylenchus dipsaci TaxID=166011 RepID=A0A915EI71_9BILA
MNELEKYRLKNAPPTMYYIPGFFGNEDEKKLVNAIESVPPSKWTVHECYKQEWDVFIIRMDEFPGWRRVARLGRADYCMHNSCGGNRSASRLPEWSMTASFTLNSPGLLDFYYPSKKGFDICNDTDEEERRRRYIGSVWLEPRSLFIFTDVAFDVLWHGMKKEKFDVITDKVFNRPADLPVEARLSVEFATVSEITLTIELVRKDEIRF